MEQERWGVIISSKVGSRKTYKYWLDVQAYIQKHGVIYDCVQSDGPGAVERLTRMLCDNGYHTMIIVGNDASLNESLNVIMTQDNLPEDFALGLIPYGPGNDFARFWGITEEDYKHSVDTFIRRQTKRIDVGYCVYTDDDNIPYKKYFLNCINIGLGAKIVEILEKFTRITGSKLLSIIPAALTNLLVQKNFTVKMNADNELVEMNVLSICIGNCHGYGQTPNSVPYNNRLDMSIILRPKWWQLAEGFWLLSKGKFLNYKNVRPYRLEKIVIDDISRAKVSLDGTSLDVKHPAPMRVGLEHEALNFIV